MLSAAFDMFFTKSMGMPCGSAWLYWQNRKGDDL